MQSSEKQVYYLLTTKYQRAEVKKWQVKKVKLCFYMQ